MWNCALRTHDADDAALAAIAEHIECRAWMDLAESAPQWLRRATGLVVDEIGGAMTLAAPGLDHVFFNRVIGLGEQTPATEELIAEIMGRYWDLSIERYWVHVGPYARPARLGPLLQELGLTQYRRSWVKLVRPAQAVEPARDGAAHSRSDRDGCVCDRQPAGRWLRSAAIRCRSVLPPDRATRLARVRRRVAGTAYRGGRVCSARVT